MRKNEPVAIAGLDLYTAFGHGTEPAWNALREGRHGFVPCKRFSNPYWESFYAALAPELEHVPDIPDFLLRTLASAADGFPDPETELFLAATVGEIEKLESPRQPCTVHSLLEKAKNVFGISRGRAVSAACASSNAAIYRAAAMLRAGSCCRAVLYASDYVSEFVLSGFATLKAVSTSSCVRPYDRERDGLLLGDAAGLLLLASRKHAEQSRLPVLGWITGCAMSCDAVHITAPVLTGDALADAIRRTLADAGHTPEDVGCVIGHGTGTLYNDRMEIHAIQQVFGPSLPPLLSVKGSTGHTLAAAGLVQLAAGLDILRTRQIPPQTSLRTPEQGAETMLSTRIRPLEKPVILSMNSGFGGLNAVILLEGDAAC